MKKLFKAIARLFAKKKKQPKYKRHIGYGIYEVIY